MLCYLLTHARFKVAEEELRLDPDGGDSDADEDGGEVVCSNAVSSKASSSKASRTPPMLVASARSHGRGTS